jgi:YbbR domain-containing protein
MRWIFRNWELKLGATGLATVLYTGLVFSGSFTEARISGVPIQRINQPNGAYVITQDLGNVQVHYRQQSRTSVPVTTESFAATVDLSQYDMQRAGQQQSLPVQVRSLADGVSWLDFSPTRVTVNLDVLDTHSVPVVLDRGTVPPGLELGTPSLSADTVDARGPRSLLNQVTAAEARVAIDASGIDFSGQVRLIPIDARGQRVDAVELAPDVISVQIPVTTQETSKTVPIRPRLVGAPAPGYQVNQVSSAPAVVTLRGTPAALASVVDVPTDQINISGLVADKAFTVKPEVPEGLRLAPGEPATVGVTVAIGPEQASRTFLVGVTCRNVPSGSTCLPQIGQISMTVGGTQPALAALKASQITPFVDAAGLAPGTYQLAPSVSLPAGITLVAFAQPQVPVVIARPSPSPTPGP